MGELEKLSSFEKCQSLNGREILHWRITFVQQVLWVLNEVVFAKRLSVFLAGGEDDGELSLFGAAVVRQRQFVLEIQAVRKRLQESARRTDGVVLHLVPERVLNMQSFSTTYSAR